MSIRPARIEDTEEILAMIYELALYEKAPEEAKATTAQIHETFFGESQKSSVKLLKLMAQSQVLQSGSSIIQLGRVSTASI